MNKAGETILEKFFAGQNGSTTETQTTKTEGQNQSQGQDSGQSQGPGTNGQEQNQSSSDQGGEKKYGSADEYYQNRRNNRPASQETGQAAGGADQTQEQKNAAASAANSSANQGEQGQSQGQENEATKYESQFLSERLGGKFKNVEELTSALTERERLVEENKRLVEESKKPKYPNDFVRDLAGAMEKGIAFEPFMRVQKMSKTPGTLGEKVERIALAKEIRFNFTQDDALFKAQREYKLALTPKDAEGNYPEGIEPDDVREAQLSLEQDLIVAEKELEQYKATTLEPLTKTQESVEKKTEAIKAAWAPEIPKISQKFAKMSFNVTLPPISATEKGKDLPFSVTLPDEVVKQIPEIVNTLISNSGADLTVGEDNDLLEAEIKEVLLAKALPAIIQAAVFNAHQDFLKTNLNKGYNSSQRQEDANAGQTGQQSTDKDREIAHMINKNFPLQKPTR